MDEFDLIDRLIAPLAVAPGAQGLANDGATISPAPGRELVVTKDMMAQGIHFLPDDSPDLIARKLLRTNLSDLAAMGARPLGYLLGFGGDGQRSEAWLSAFVDGLASDQEAFGISLLGGDTIAVPGGVLTLSLTAFGEVETGRSLTRSGAQPGDLLAVSGTLGDAALGLQVLKGELRGLEARHATFLAGRYRIPQPRSGLGPALVGVAGAALDVSDGLVADAGHIARRSGLALEIDWPAIPLSPAARSALDASGGGRLTVLAGGDDYELLFTVAPGDRQRMDEIAGQCGVAITIIGRCMPGRGVTVLDEKGEKISTARAGWRHLS